MNDENRRNDLLQFFDLLYCRVCERKVLWDRRQCLTNALPVCCGKIMDPDSREEEREKTLLAAKQGLDLIHTGGIDPGALLSHREMEVFLAMAMGQHVCEIAGELDLAYSTIETHKQSIAKKVGSHSAMDWARLALRSGWLTYTEWLFNQAPCIHGKRSAA
ncbi:MAG: LuxR C-terminal-related transcriptional regulator [Verrucomicrobiota bacterium]